jgi:hypothetical protein
MESDAVSLSYVLAVLAGWLLAKDKYSSLIAKEKDLHVTLATQTLYLNGMGEISSDDFDTHDRVAEQVRQLATADSSWLQSQVVRDIEDA